MANKNKVYVNPNFNRLLPPSVPPTALVNSKVTMHVNPNFSQQALPTSKKIYVNPNFLSTKVQNSVNEIGPNRVISNNQPSTVPTVPVAIKPVVVSTEPSISKSRYSLIRKNTNKVTLNNAIDTGAPTTMQINKYKSVSINNYSANLKPTNSCSCTGTRKPIQGTDTRTTTVKINKYKTVAITKFRKNLEFPAGLSNITLNHHPITFKSNATIDKSTSHTPKSYKNKYKFSKLNSSLRLDKSAKASSSTSIPIRYKNIKLKMTKKSLKKNNIPCPLYRKYGKCLRSIKGTCEFLHDKKHVSICRKFLKGICREENCLLSHDVSTKKMPTCSFYLKGMCTKTDCPYLHVKLNDKSKVCLDFLRGYCEKGDLCLNRHINVNSHKKSKFSTNHSIRPKVLRKSNSSNLNQTIKSSSSQKIARADLKPMVEVEDHQKPREPNTSESRYYNEVIIKSGSETDELIKPTRCKLGALPSYIKF